MATVELRRAVSTRKYDEKLGRHTGESFDRGEREIIVDGIRWGRTIVTSRGSGGTRTTFLQDGAGELEENPGARYPNPYTVRSAGRRRSMWDKAPQKSTEELTLEMAQKLVADGILRHPDVVKAEQAEAAARYRAEREKEEAGRRALFEAKARETITGLIGAFGLGDAVIAATITRIADALEWARDQ